MNRVVLVNPPSVTQKNDYTGTGAVYWPIPLAIIAAILDKKYEVKVLDMFGENPKRIVADGKLILHGMPIEGASLRIKADDIVVIYSGHVIAHTAVLKLIECIRLSKPKKIIVVENTNFVNAYPLDYFYDDFKKAGAVIIAGDPYGVIRRAIKEDYDSKGRHQLLRADSLPMPKWEGFPLENYWALGYAHAPKTSDRYIQIYTSFGCNQKCNFCTNPYINKSKWRPKSVEKILEEIYYWYDKGIGEFHIEDLNPTIDKKRIKYLCQKIIDRGIFIKMKIASGTKIETLDEDTLLWMYDAGFDYLSFSPESGSDRVLALMNKKFDHRYALKLINFINSSRFINPMITQACFVLGYPGEEDVDLALTFFYAHKLVEAGVDEFAFFNFVPSVGAIAAKNISIRTNDMTFSSDWRGYNRHLKNLRFRWVLELYMTKLVFYPKKTIYRFFRTKTWMTIKRVFL